MRGFILLYLALCLTIISATSLRWDNGNFGPGWNRDSGSGSGSRSVSDGSGNSAVNARSQSAGSSVEVQDKKDEKKEKKEKEKEENTLRVFTASNSDKKQDEDKKDKDDKDKNSKEDKEKKDDSVNKKDDDAKKESNKKDKKDKDKDDKDKDNKKNKDKEHKKNKDNDFSWFSFNDDDIDDDADAGAGIFGPMDNSHGYSDEDYAFFDASTTRQSSNGKGMFHEPFDFLSAITGLFGDILTDNNINNNNNSPNPHIVLTRVASANPYGPYGTPLPPAVPSFGRGPFSPLGSSSNYQFGGGRGGHGPTSFFGSSSRYGFGSSSGYGSDCGNVNEAYQQGYEAGLAVGLQMLTGVNSIYETNNYPTVTPTDSAATTSPPVVVPDDIFTFTVPTINSQPPVDIPDRVYDIETPAYVDDITYDDSGFYTGESEPVYIDSAPQSTGEESSQVPDTPPSAPISDASDTSSTISSDATNSDWTVGSPFYPTPSSTQQPADADGNLQFLPNDFPRNPPVDVVSTRSFNG